MKRLLLSLTVLLATLCTSAYEVGDYIYTSDAKFKVIGNNAVPALTQWTGAGDVDTWSVSTEDGYTNCLQSLDGSEGSTILTTSTPLTFGSYYVVTLKVKGVAEVASSTTAGAQNEINAFITAGEPSATGILTGEANKDYFMVASSQTILNGEWAEISFALVDTCTDATIGAGAHYLNVTIGRLTTDTYIADAEVREVVSVYDTRIMDRKINFAQKIIADANFNEGADSGELEEVIGMYQEMLETGGADDQSEMEGLVDMLNDAMKAYMDTNSEDLSSNFANIGITGVGKYNRGGIADGQLINNFMFRGDNWLHADGADYLNKQIQGSYTNSAGSVALYNTNIPAGKYYIAGEVMNAFCDKNYAYTYTLEKNVKIFVGSDTVDCGLIKGRDFVKFYMVGEIKNGETFEAGFWWEGHDAGTAFQVKNFEVRGFGDISAKIAYQEAWNAFITQWNAATNARNSLISYKGNASYPWEQDSLQRALDAWDVYYNEILGNWIDAEGNDLGKATTEELEEWTVWQGREEHVDDVDADKYQVTRGYQRARDYVEAQNAPYINLVAKIAEAKAAVANPNYSHLDASDLNAAIEEAEALVKAVTATNQGDDFNSAKDALQEVLQEFYNGGASYAEQAELAVVNPDFMFKSENVTGGESATDASGGWNSYTTNTSEYWRIGDGGKDENGEYVYESRNRAAMWRGWTGSPLGSLTQDITVTRAGHYSFKCQAYCTLDGGGQSKSVEILNGGVRRINIQTEMQEVWDEDLEEYVEQEVEISRDTTYISGIRLLFGSVTENKIDSLDIWTSGESTVAVWTPQWFILDYDKATDGEEVLRFGMSGLEAKTYNPYTYTPNAYGFGSVHVLYGGPSDKFYEDKAAGIETTEVVDRQAKPVAYYSISGARTTAAQKGIVIVKYSDGSVKKIYNK